ELVLGESIRHGCSSVGWVRGPGRERVVAASRPRRRGMMPEPARPCYALRRSALCRAAPPFAMTFRRLGLPFAPLVALSVFASGAACGNTSAPSPFPAADAGSDAGSGGAGGGALFDAGEEIDPTLGGPCLDDPQCNDNIDCTFDACDKALGRCRNV